MPFLTTPTLGAYSPRPFLDPPGLGNAGIVVAMAAGTQSGAYRTYRAWSQDTVNTRMQLMMQSNVFDVQQHFHHKESSHCKLLYY